MPNIKIRIATNWSNNMYLIHLLAISLFSGRASWAKTNLANSTISNSFVLSCLFSRNKTIPFWLERLITTATLTMVSSTSKNSEVNFFPPFTSGSVASSPARFKWSFTNLSKSSSTSWTHLSSCLGSVKKIKELPCSACDHYSTVDFCWIQNVRIFKHFNLWVSLHIGLVSFAAFRAFILVCPLHHPWMKNATSQENSLAFPVYFELACHLLGLAHCVSWTGREDFLTARVVCILRYQWSDLTSALLVSSMCGTPSVVLLPIVPTILLTYVDFSTACQFFSVTRKLPGYPLLCAPHLRLGNIRVSQILFLKPSCFRVHHIRCKISLLPGPPRYKRLVREAVLFPFNLFLSGSLHLEEVTAWLWHF